jgi:hypothetical protein
MDSTPRCWSNCFARMQYGQTWVVNMRTGFMGSCSSAAEALELLECPIFAQRRRPCTARWQTARSAA